MEPISIQNFYAKKSLLITGCTGFIGQLVIHKICSVFQNVDHIYVMVREKHGKTTSDRVDEFLKKPIFKFISDENPEFKNKIIGIHGDLALKGLGLSEEDKEKLIKNVNIVFHLGASVDFTEKLSVAAQINFLGTKALLDFCKKINHLDAVIYVSTAYSNCIRNHIDECIYDAPKSIKWQELNDILVEENYYLLDDAEKSLIDEWPNTYTFTKAITEQMVNEYKKDLPIGIFRPGIVISTAYEPIEGWFDNFQSPTGLVAMVLVGIGKVFLVDESAACNTVPGDMCANAIISSAWDVSNTYKMPSDNKTELPIPIYNFTMPASVATWGDFLQLVRFYIKKYPVEKAIWYPICVTTKSPLIFSILFAISLRLPKKILEIIVKLTGANDLVLKQLRKVEKNIIVINYFTKNSWTFEYNNVKKMWQKLSEEERNLLKFNTETFSLFSYFDNYMKGIRKILFRENMDTLPRAFKKMQKLYWIHYSVLGLLFFLFYALVFYFFAFFKSFFA